jgi:hypothetical protein
MIFHTLLVHLQSLIDIISDELSVSGKLLLALGSTVILGFAPRGTHGHIFASRDFE